MKNITNSKTKVSGAELARITGVTQGLISKLAKSGELPRESDGTYNLDQAIQIMIQREGEDAHPEDRSIRLRMLEAKTRLAEITLAEKQGQTVTIDAVMREIEPLFGNLRAQLLTLPRKIAPIIQDGMTAGEREAVITKSIHDAMRELATLPERIQELDNMNKEGDIRTKKA